MNTKTEAEARKKRCCNPVTVYGLTPQGDVVIYNRVDCEASACMAWRWVDYRITNDGADTKGPIYRLIKEVTQGYCGLAGRPE